jgi:hypothetical protein
MHGCRAKCKISSMRLRMWGTAPFGEGQVQRLSQYRAGLKPAPTIVGRSVDLCGRRAVAVEVGAGFKPALFTNRVPTTALREGNV